ncbi:anti-sigma factor [Lentzea sp. CC55]|uniref:anti-sigma factor n=1 Tax=Lentzea sp. CC55 TaxID=2884909 RepID=UPI0027E20696|nr:anti-sigma factor [Lentzea sp. CC55]MCG8926058.1 anti-sigma factor [Lentzea sp. CC55]
MKPGPTRATNPHLLTGAHALGALPGAERAEFEEHLVRCRACADESAGLVAAAALLGGAVDHVTPANLRTRVLEAVRLVRQVPTGSEAVTVSSRRQGFLRAGALFAAACLTAAAVAGVHGALTASVVTPVAASPHTPVGDLLAAPDLRLVAAGDRAGTVAMSRSRDEALFLADGLRPLPGDRVYQLWLVDEHGPRSAGTARATGEVLSLLATGVGEAGEVVLTVEPAGGSPGPTSAPVVTVDLH